MLGSEYMIAKLKELIIKQWDLCATFSQEKITSSPKGNDRSPESQHVCKMFLETSQVSKLELSEDLTIAPP